MQTIPNSTLYLCKNVELDPNYNYTIDFENITAQANYFDSKIATEFEINEGYSYIRDSQSLKVQANIDDLLGINYLFYNNGNKRYYAFITKKEYINTTCTSLSFKLDVLQSFMFNYEIDESFIEREHQDRYSTDLKPIYNLESEQLERGNNYKVISFNQYLNTNIKNGTYTGNLDIYLKPYDEGGTRELFFLQIIAKEPLNMTSEPAYNINGEEVAGTSASLKAVSRCNGVCSNIYAYVGLYAPHGTAGGYGNVFMGVKETSGSSVWHWGDAFNNENLKSLSEDPRVISISVSKYCPFKFDFDIDNTTLGRHILVVDKTQPMQTYLIKYAHDNTLTTNALLLITNINQNSLEFNLSSENNINLDINNLKNIEYEPKLKTSDYCFNEVQLFNQRKKYYNEYITNDTKFNLIETYSIKASSAIKVNKYNNITDIDDNVVVDGTTTEVPLRTDAWLNYLAQNKNSLITGYKTNLIGTIANVGLGLATRGIGLAVAGTQAINTALSINNQMAKIQDIKETPDNVQATNFDLLLDNALRNLLVKLYVYEIHPQFKQKIFNYFYHYGYKCNDFKKPNTRSRYYFNYIKTIGANIKTNIDADFRAEIENAYNNGITIWHYRNATTFKGVNNYDYENVELNLMEV